MSSHATAQCANDAAIALHERHGMPLDRISVQDRREGIAFPFTTLARELIGYAGTWHACDPVGGAS
jgi:hypothetical protein